MHRGEDANSAAEREIRVTIELLIDFSELGWDETDDLTPVRDTVHDVPTVDAPVEALPERWREAVEAVRSLPRRRA